MDFIQLFPLHRMGLHGSRPKTPRRTPITMPALRFELPDLPRTRTTGSQKRKKQQDFSCRRFRMRCYRSGKPQSRRCSFQSSGIGFLVSFAMDSPSGSIPARIASTMSGRNSEFFKVKTGFQTGGIGFENGSAGFDFPEIRGWERTVFSGKGKTNLSE